MSAPRRHILFLNNSGYGHVIPTLEVVAELLRRGHEVSYVTGGAMADRVAATGARVLGYDSGLVHVDLSEIVTAADAARMPAIYLRESRDILDTVLAGLGDRRPDLVAYDLTVYHAGRILARKWDVPAARCFPALASNEHYSFLDRLIEKMGRASPRHPALLSFVADLTRLLAEHGQHDTRIERLIGDVERLNLVCYPRSFQPAGATFDDRFVFVGPCLDHVALAEEQAGPADPARWTPPGDGRPVLLISLGTSVNRQPGFFRTCVDTFRDAPWHVVLAVHRGVDPAELGPLPPHIEAHRWVPQLAVLEHADVFVSHAGLGSVMGAMYRGTPVVLVPSSPEHKVNAQRVAELGLGRVLREDGFSPQRLRAAVAEVAADQLTRRRVLAMQHDIRQAGGGPAAADAIERQISNWRPGNTGAVGVVRAESRSLPSLIEDSIRH